MSVSAISSYDFQAVAVVVMPWGRARWYEKGFERYNFWFITQLAHALLIELDETRFSHMFRCMMHMRIGIESTEQRDRCLICAFGNKSYDNKNNDEPFTSLTFHLSLAIWRICCVWQFHFTYPFNLPKFITYSIQFYAISLTTSRGERPYSPKCITYIHT